MKENYPTLTAPEVTSAPYMRPRERKTRRRHSLSSLLLLVLLMLAGAFFVYRAMPASVKVPLLTWLFGTESEGDTQTTAGQTTTEAPDPPQTTSDLYFWQCELPQGATAILPVDLSANTQGVFLENPTDAVPEVIVPEFVRVGAGEVSVLILNTHSFEAYSAERSLYFDDPSYAYIGDENRNVGAVCRSFADALNRNGVGAVFVDCMATSGIGSYQNARRMAELALAEYPDVKLIVDLHRGVVKDSTGAVLRPVAPLFGEALAQVRLIVGADAAFETNMAAALALFGKASLTHGELMMPTAVQDGALLQTLPVPVLTMEIGTCGNYVSEAQRSAELLAEVIAELMCAQGGTTPSPAQ
ncbi:MAG: stage II sporulation protein P [Clostridia bacterium]|nr:stage II sporulation protein P [Clostridia bacterium]